MRRDAFHRRNFHMHDHKHVRSSGDHDYPVVHGGRSGMGWVFRPAHCVDDRATGPFTWSIVSGALPTGFLFNVNRQYNDHLRHRHEHGNIQFQRERQRSIWLFYTAVLHHGSADANLHTHRGGRRRQPTAGDFNAVERRHYGERYDARI